MNQLVLTEGTIAYDDQGSGPLVIMLPGLGDLRQEYRFLAPQLIEAGYRVVTADLRGHGQSSTEWPDYSRVSAGRDLLALIDHLGVASATVVGNSFAAAPAVWAAAERPDAVKGLVLIGPFVRATETPLHMKLLIRTMFQGPWKVRAWKWYYSTLFPTRKPADFNEYRNSLAAYLGEKGRFTAVRAMMFSSEPEIEQRLREVRAQTLVVMGSKDPDFPDPATEASWLAEQVGGEVSLIEGAGHYPQSEMPEDTGAAVLNFLRRL